MTVLRNNFEGGPDGSDITVASSGRFGDDPFDSVSSNSATLEYSTQFSRPTAEYLMHTTIGTGSSRDSRVTWSTSMGAQAQIWFRVYAYYATPPMMNASTMVFQAYSGGTNCAWLGIADTTDFIFFADTTTANFVEGTVAIQAGEWVRVECRIEFSTTTGNAEVRYFTEADSDTPTEILTVTDYDLGAATADTFSFGYTFPTNSVPSLYLSGLELNTEGWPGPAPFRPGKGVPGILTNPIAIHSNAS